ncbi:MAG: hypothetical protein GY900_11460 [Actinomycetia bacterium]|jgi:hypothetical protein|nr:hypothetical protein [Actinomycetales bacterium]MCP4852336.1 hypothetical protein [Actinomycetes bacterium]
MPGWGIARGLIEAHLRRVGVCASLSELSTDLEVHYECAQHDILGLLLGAGLPWHDPVALAWATWVYEEGRPYSEATPLELDSLEGACAADLVTLIVEMMMHHPHAAEDFAPEGWTRADMPDWHNGYPEGW